MKIKTFVITGIIALGASFSLATTANADTHTVTAGESLWSIGEAYGETPEQLVAENAGKLSSINSIILPGESLEVGDYSTTSSTKSYTNSNTTNYSQPAVSAGSNQTETNSTANTSSSSVADQSDGVSAAHSSAANQIAQAESGGSYSVRNGNYVGRYQLSASYLNGDYSKTNQDRTFVKYCDSRYGSVAKALAFRQANGWY